MGFHLNSLGGYYEGDKASLGHIDVPQRPSQFHHWQAGEWVLDAAAELGAKLSSIDAAAEEARRKYCKHPILALEYQYAYADASAWLANQTAPIPPTVQEWATIKGWTPLQAAQDIDTAGAFLNAKLLQIRSIRLHGKDAVVAGTKTVDAVLAELGAA